MRHRLLDLLAELPPLETPAGRELLLQDLPLPLQHTIPHTGTTTGDLAHIVDACDRWDPDPAAGTEHPLRLLLAIAVILAEGRAQAAQLQALLNDLPAGERRAGQTFTPPPL